MNQCGYVFSYNSVVSGFKAKAYVNGAFHYITGIIIHPKWTKRRDEFDIALVCFKTLVKGGLQSDLPGIMVP